MAEIHTSQGPAPNGSRPRGQEGPPPRILIVDDDPLTRRLNVEMLNTCGYEVDDAADGAVAWEALNTDIYDLLITDHDVPEVSGVELLKKLRAARMALPVIIASETLRDDEFTQYPGLRPDAMLAKPYTMPDLLQKVREVLGGVESALII